MEALRIIVPFASTYLCESGFSTLMHSKSKVCNKLNVKEEMSLVITKARPYISKLAFNMQQQKLH